MILDNMCYSYSQLQKWHDAFNIFVARLITISAVKTETSKQKNVSNIFFFSENILFNTFEYM